MLCKIPDNAHADHAAATGKFPFDKWHFGILRIRLSAQTASLKERTAAAYVLIARDYEARLQGIEDRGQLSDGDCIYTLAHYTDILELPAIAATPPGWLIFLHCLYFAVVEPAKGSLWEKYLHDTFTEVPSLDNPKWTNFDEYWELRQEHRDTVDRLKALSKELSRLSDDTSADPVLPSPILLGARPELDPPFTCHLSSDPSKPDGIAPSDHIPEADDLPSEGHPPVLPLPPRPIWVWLVVAAVVFILVIGISIPASQSPNPLVENPAVLLGSNETTPITPPKDFPLPFTKGTIPEVKKPPAPAPVPPLAPELRGHTANVRFLAFTPDGLRLVSASNKMTTIKSPNEPNKFSFGTDDSLRVWKVQSGQQIRYFDLNRGSTFGSQGLCLSANGELAAVSSGWEWSSKTATDPTIQVFDLASELRTHHIKVSGDRGMRAVKFSNDGTKLFATQSGPLLLAWSLTAPTASELEPIVRKGAFYGEMPLATAFSPDGEHIASAHWEKAGWGIYVWTRADGELKWHLRTPPVLTTALSFSSDGTRLVSAGNDHTIRLWNMESGKELLAIRNLDTIVCSIALSAKGDWFVTGEKDGVVRVWDAVTNKERASFAGHAKPVSSLALSPKGEIIAAGYEDGMIRMWRLPSAE